MNIRDLIPWTRDSASTGLASRDFNQSPFVTLQREMNRLFDDAFRDFDVAFPLSRFPLVRGRWPSVDISENDKEVTVTAEVPGLTEKDVEVTLANGVLTIRGEKRAETEDKPRQFSERFYGSFERRFDLGVEVQEDKVEATFAQGVLTVKLPKSEKAGSQVKRIAIKS
jgi:HSP20 family protein